MTNFYLLRYCRSIAQARESEKDPQARYEKLLKSTQRASQHGSSSSSATAATTATTKQSTNTSTSGSFGGRPKTIRHMNNGAVKAKAGASMPAWMNKDSNNTDEN